MSMTNERGAERSHDHISEVMVEQLRMILADQRQELADIRESRRRHRERITYYDGKEIEALLGIRKTEEMLAEYGDNTITEGEGYFGE